MQQEILLLAKKLIAIPSTAGDSKALGDVLVVAKKELGNSFSKEEFESDGVSSLLVSNSTKATRHFKIILNAHLDVVPGTAKQYLPVVKNGKLYGRGAYDMKAAGAVMILLFKELGKKVHYPLALQLVTDEETFGFHGAKYQLEKGIRTDFVIAGENTDLRISNKAKGILGIKVKVNGKTAHGAYPWLGENALLKLHSELNKLLQIYPIPQQESWQTTINVARIETPNITLNKVPDYAEANLNIRFTPEEKDHVMNKIKKSVSSDTEVELVMSEPHQFTDERNSYIEELKRQIKNVTKKDAIMYATHGGSDVRFYEARNIPSVCFGPIGSGHHSDEEWVDIKSLEDYYTILRKFLLAYK